MKTFKVMGLMLTYPVPETVGYWKEMAEMLANEKLLPNKQLKAVQGWIDKNSEADIYSLQERYVETFDRGRGHCLHLFEHVHGESRERGQAMVDLTEMYAAKGLTINEAELPDYLPMFLEYCSLCEYEEAQSLLNEIAHILVSIGTKLKQRENDYHVIFESLVALAKAKVDQKVVDAAVAFVQAEDESLEALDKEWEEAEAFGGDPRDQVDCASCQPLDRGLQQSDEQVVRVLGGVQ